MKPGTFKPVELTAEFGKKLMNFLRELNKLNATFHLQKRSASGKVVLNSLKNVHFFKNYKKIHVLKILSIMQLQFSGIQCLSIGCDTHCTL